MQKLIFTLVLIVSFSAFSQSDRKLPNGQLAYYGQDFYSKKVTIDLLRKILNECHSTLTNKPDLISTSCGVDGYRHTSVGYDSARKILFGEIYKQQDGKGTFVQDVYCQKKFYYRTLSEVSNMHREVNIEHTWPQSRFNHNYDKNMQKSDMHHLFLTDSDANNRRANHEFGEYSNDQDELNVENCDNSHMTHINGHFIFTPPTEHRGNVARALFYFSVRYNLPIGKAEEMIIRQWHKVDPVDAKEIARHEMIAKHQKVRNPFVDFPTLVDQISDF